jgi:aspartate-semialdehyde dehydrogenase
MLVVLKPLHERFWVKRVVVSTYQAVSGSGTAAIAELKQQAGAMLDGGKPVPSVYPHPIAFNAIPQIDVFLDNRYTNEEMKMVHETHKMLDPAIVVSLTAVRVPVFRGHSESLNIEFEKPYEMEEVFSILASAPGVEVVDDPAASAYSLALNAEGKNSVFVGRIRRDVSLDQGLNLWIVSDNLRKGAALNAVQIAGTLVEMELL